jgi:hypothetical protein
MTYEQVTPPIRPEWPVRLNTLNLTYFVILKGHGNEPNFPSFLHKSLWPRSLALHFALFRFWLRIRGDIRIDCL